MFILRINREDQQSYMKHQQSYFQTRFECFALPDIADLNHCSCFFSKPRAFIRMEMKQFKEYWYCWRWIKCRCGLCTISTSIFISNSSSSPKWGRYCLNIWYNTDIKQIHIFKFTEHEVDKLMLIQFIKTYIWSVLRKSIFVMLLHFVLNRHRIPSTPTLLFTKLIFVYISLMTRANSIAPWRGGALPRFQYDCVLRYFWLTYPQLFYASEGCSREILASNVPDIIIAWIR
jgi:hypothetical protein